MQKVQRVRISKHTHARAHIHTYELLNIVIEFFTVKETLISRSS
jgi:hypothetical protein